MGRDATKAAGNPWYQARKKAAEYDDRLCSRERAAEQLGMSVSSLADAELGNTKFMPVDKAVLMADRYNAPWLLNHYCLNECPIGCRHSLSDEVVGIDRVTVKLLKSLKTEKLGDVKDTLLDIAADGKITEDEKPALQEVLAYLDDLAKTVSELKTIGEMALNEDGDAHGSKYGAPTSRKRFVLIARCDGKPIVWPEPTHAPRDSEAVKSGRLKPWRSAAEIIDWSLPCPSIFDTKEKIKERYNLKAVRPLADNTMRRIIRGVDKFTIKSGQPYIVPTGYGERKGQAPRVHDIEEPLPTVVGSGKHNLCKPVLVPFTATNTSNSVGAPAGDPVHTVTTAGNQMLVTPYLAECNHAGGGHVADVRGPYKTITAKHTGGIVAPSLIQYHTEQTENVRASGLGAPIPTVDASNRYGLTCANLVKYYSGVVGEKMEEPLPTVTAIDHNAVCAAHVVKFKGDNLGSSPAEPMQTVTAGAGQKKACGGGTFALCDTLLCKAGPDENLYRWPLIRDLLNRYCGYELADDDLLLLSIGGTLYFIADIGLRMLSPRELYNTMGFPPDYIIDRDYMGNPYPKNEQVARCGNAVCPPMAAAVARANFPEYVAKVGDTITTMAALLDMVAV